MSPRVSRWFNDSIAIERGPLVFSYGIGESWVKLRDRGMTAEWEVFPLRQWNYALDVEVASPAKGIAVKETEVGKRPFTRRQPPCSLRSRRARSTNGAPKMVPPTSLPQEPRHQRPAGRDRSR